jgi:hypothetical protein
MSIHGERRRRSKKVARGERVARGPWIELRRLRRAPEVRGESIGHYPRALPARVRSFTARDPGAAQPDGRLHLATFLSRLRRVSRLAVGALPLHATNIALTFSGRSHNLRARFLVVVQIFFSLVLAV